jgi:hypothetical protein
MGNIVMDPVMRTKETSHNSFGPNGKVRINFFGDQSGFFLEPIAPMSHLSRIKLAANFHTLP